MKQDKNGRYVECHITKKQYDRERYHRIGKVLDIHKTFLQIGKKYVSVETINNFDGMTFLRSVDELSDDDISQFESVIDVTKNPEYTSYYIATHK